jgi:hypothetical protein
MTAATPLSSLQTPVNSAAYWSHLYEADDVESEEAELIDLTSTSTPLDLSDRVSSPA